MCMGDRLYDKCDCGATKIASKKKCTNCWLNSQHHDCIVDNNNTSTLPKNDIEDSLYNKCNCGATKIASKEKCTDCWLDSQNHDCIVDNDNTSTVVKNEIKKCRRCNNLAKKNSDLCGPCIKVRRGLCGKKDCSNRISIAKGHRYCGLHNGTPKTQIKCRVCKKGLQPRSVGERALRGTKGAGVGTITGGLIGTFFGPVGTLIGAGLGGLLGSSDGSQIENLCDNCCRFCENKKSQCICNKIIGLCRSCGCNVTRSNSSNGFCYTCSNSWFGDDL